MRHETKHLRALLSQISIGNLISPKLFMHSLCIFLLIGITSVQGAFTLYVQNPWRDEPEYNKKLYLHGNDEFGWSPNGSTEMQDLGNGWYMLLIEKSPKNQTYPLSISRRLGNDWTFDQKELGTMEALFGGLGQYENTIWILFDDAASNKKVTGKPEEAGAVTLHFLNPWPETSPKMNVQGHTFQMSIDTEHDGWYTSYVMGDLAVADLTFTDYFEQSHYTNVGKSNNAEKEPIVLTPFKDSGLTLFIWPEPKPIGPPKIATSFPEIYGDSPFKTITAIVRDQKEDGYSFEMNDGNDQVIKGMVEEYLTEKGKLKKGKVTYKSEDIEKWFENQILGNDITNDTCIDIELRKTEQGGWEFNSDWYGGFYPIDYFNPHNDPLYEGEDGKVHNFHFTMEIHSQFEYYKGKKQLFQFTGDDDVWVFINGRLAIDLGATHMPASDEVNLDAIADKFGLKDGETYSLDMFYCERQTAGSNFKMVSTFNLRTDYELITDKKEKGSSEEYLIKELIISGGLDERCGFNIYDSTTTDTVTATVDFFLSGPHFDEKIALEDGTHYGGITIKGDSMVIIDTAKITELINGIYTISFISKQDKSLTGFVQFEVVNNLKIPNVSLNTSYDTLYNKGILYMGEQLSYTLETDADSLRSTTEEENPEKGDVYTGDALIIKKDSPDTVTVKTCAYGNGTEPTKHSFTLIRDTLPPLRADTSATPFCKFTDKLDVSLSLSKKAESNRWKAVRIFYTLDGTTPDSTRNEYDGPIEINESLPLKAIAYAVNAVPSPILHREYYKVSHVKKACYKDTNGDGYIETIEIELNNPAQSPDSIEVCNPFDKKETRVITEYTINESLITASFDDAPFTGEEIRTDFSVQKLARLFGDYYLSDSFKVADSVAPVVLWGELCPGGPIQPRYGRKLTRKDDTLRVQYSEPISIENTDEPYTFKGEKSYSITLKDVEVEGRILTAIVDTLIGSYPKPGSDKDSLRIEISSATKDKSDVTQKVKDNRYAPLYVKEAPYLLMVTPISPFNPDSLEEIPEALQPLKGDPTHAQITVADFLMLLKNPKDIDGSIQIYDPVGNLVISLSSKEDSNDSIGAYLAKGDDRTRFIFYWTGKNRQGRKVGGAMYMALITVTDPQGVTTSFRKYIGVKK